VTSTQMGSVALEQENKDLIQKLARILEERSILEEKVRYLESSNSTMASDLIQHYSNDKRGSVTGKVLKNKHIYQCEKADPASSDPVGPCSVLLGVVESCWALFRDVRDQLFLVPVQVPVIFFSVPVLVLLKFFFWSRSR
jgi:hypothetical protein